MTQTAIPFLFMRGGTSRGPYFNRADLPADLDQLSAVLISALGSGHPLNIDGIGGGNAVTTKVAMLSKSDDEWADVDYFFAQVSVLDGLVDYKPTCGNILSGVGSAALEMGLLEADDGATEVKIKAVNTGARILAKVQTPNGHVTYEGDEEIAGVPGCHAPVELNFFDVTGSQTGAFLPTGNLRDTIDGIEVTCMDVAMPMVIARATDFGLTGHESREELDANRAFFDRMEALRQKASLLMGMGDATKSVVPKFGLLADPQGDGHLAARYFMPWTTHPTLAVTGAQCMASCALAEGTIADGLMDRPDAGPFELQFEHPLGLISVLTDFERKDGAFVHRSSGLLRNARLLAKGDVFVPYSVWDGTV